MKYLNVEIVTYFIFLQKKKKNHDVIIIMLKKQICRASD